METSLIVAIVAGLAALGALAGAILATYRLNQADKAKEKEKKEMGKWVEWAQGQLNAQEVVAQLSYDQIVDRLDLARLTEIVAEKVALDQLAAHVQVNPAQVAEHVDVNAVVDAMIPRFDMKLLATEFARRGDFALKTDIPAPDLSGFASKTYVEDAITGRIRKLGILPSVTPPAPKPGSSPPAPLGSATSPLFSPPPALPDFSQFVIHSELKKVLADFAEEMKTGQAAQTLIQGQTVPYPASSSSADHADFLALRALREKVADVDQRSVRALSALRVLLETDREFYSLVSGALCAKLEGEVRKLEEGIRKGLTPLEDALEAANEALAEAEREVLPNNPSKAQLRAEAEGYARQQGTEEMSPDYFAAMQNWVEKRPALKKERDESLTKAQEAGKKAAEALKEFHADEDQVKARERLEGLRARLDAFRGLEGNYAQVTARLRDRNSMAPGPASNPPAPSALDRAKKLLDDKGS